MSVLAVLAFAFVGVVGTLLLIIVVVFVIDRLQTGDAIRGNYPVLGRFRHLSSQLGEFFASFFLCDGSRGIAILSLATRVAQARQ